jgi:hypothetical protein
MCPLMGCLPSNHTRFPVTVNACTRFRFIIDQQGGSITNMVGTVRLDRQVRVPQGHTAAYGFSSSYDSGGPGPASLATVVNTRGLGSLLIVHLRALRPSAYIFPMAHHIAGANFPTGTVKCLLRLPSAKQKYVVSRNTYASLLDYLEMSRSLAGRCA